jgi:anaerobic sulfite reductase subunit A
MDRSHLAKLLRDREVIYTFLGRACEKEVDKQLLGDLFACRELFEESSFIKSNAVHVKSGFEELYGYLSKLSERGDELDKAILELAVDYADLFLGVGQFRKGEGIAHPSESVYLTGYLYSDVVEEIFDTYLEEGLVKSPDFKEPEDHIALELYFMAHLCRKAREFIESGAYQEALKYLNKQKAFLDKHLLKWAPLLAEDIIKYANTAFYRAVGKIMRGFLEIEGANVSELIERVRDML